MKSLPWPMLLLVLKQLDPTGLHVAGGVALVGVAGAVATVVAIEGGLGRRRDTKVTGRVVLPPNISPLQLIPLTGSTMIGFSL